MAQSISEDLNSPKNNVEASYFWRNIFCGCTLNKNISNDVITLDIKVNIKDDKEEHELELLEKKGELDIKIEEQIKEIQEIKNNFNKDDENDENDEDEEIIDILTEKPVEKTEESKTTSRKYLFF